MDKKISLVIERMDVPELHKVMKKLNWEWSTTGRLGDLKVPSETDIVLYVVELLSECKRRCLEEQKSYYRIETAGFYCSYQSSTETEDERYDCKFVISHGHSDEDYNI